MDNLFVSARVFLVSAPQLNPEGVQAFYDSEGITAKVPNTENQADGDTIPEIGGRICYMSFDNPRPGGNAAYLHHIKEVGHGSVFEHSNFTLVFTGVSRSLTHELVRHRAGFAYSQLSQRYVDESKASFIVPSAIKGDPELEALFEAAVRTSRETYGKLVEKLMEKFDDIPDRTLRRKKARQAARSVLPNSTETKIQVTANARGWRHFIEMRGSRHADDEIRDLTFEVLTVLNHAAPGLFGDYQIVEYAPGEKEVVTQFRKV